LARISGCLEKLTTVLGKLCEVPDDEGEKNAAKSGGGNEYVS